MPTPLTLIPSWKRLLALVLLGAPLLAWFVVKPVRLLAPELVGVTCQAGPVCVEVEAQRDEATQLYVQAMGFMASHVGPVANTPRFVFCSTAECANAFGLGERSAVTLGTTGTVIGPQAWKDYYVRHELIHHLQAQKLGVVSLLFKPRWWVEGMAYHLSEDPRTPLSEPWEGHRSHFVFWYLTTPRETLWQAAEKL